MIAVTIESEKTILGSVLYFPNFAGFVFGVLSSQDFFDPKHQQIFKVMETLFADGIEINTLSLINGMKLRNVNNIPEDYIIELLDFAVDVNSAKAFIKQMKEAAAIRAIKQGLDKLNQDLNSGNTDLGALTSDLNKLVGNVSKQSTVSRTKTGDALLESVMQKLDKERSEFVTTGLPDFDPLIVDNAPEEVIVWAARPGVGKTAMMVQSALFNLKQGKKVGFISLEMPASQLVLRMLAAMSSVDGVKLQKMSFEQLAEDPELQSNLMWIVNSPFYIEDEIAYDVQSIAAAIRKMRIEHGIDIVYVDYLQLVDAGDKEGNRANEVAKVSKTFKALGKELKIPMHLASQINRGVENRMSNEPNLADLRESGAIEQDASIVIFLYPDLTGIMDEAKGGATNDDIDRILKERSEFPVIIKLAKQRNGNAGFKKRIKFVKSFGRFESYEQPHTYLNEKEEFQGF